MFPLRRCLIAFSILFAMPLHAATGGGDWFYRGSDIPPDPAWQFGTLANGLRYAIRRNPLPAGQVSIRVRIDAGSLNERDDERGWAHYVEHLAFRGTKSFGDRNARHIWQQLGASFGSDTNASTDSHQTIYQLDLPRSDHAALDQSFSILAEMVDNALFDPAAVEAERKIVLAEKRRRSEIATRINDISRPLFYAGLKYAERDTIGTDETLTKASAQGLRDFYERWYRPDRTILVVVGDADPATIRELIAARFGQWKASGTAPPEPDYGQILEVKDRVATLAYPGAPNGGTIVWLRPHVTKAPSIKREREELAEMLAAQIISRRLEARARHEAAFISAGLGVFRQRHVADITQLSLTVREGRWREALVESFAIIADAVRTPPSSAEISRELSNLRTSLVSAVAGEDTIKSQQWAQRLVYAVNSEDVVTSAPAMLSLFEQLAPQMTPALLAETGRTLFSGAGPRLLLLTPQPVPGGTATVSAALAAAEQAAPAARDPERNVSFDALPPLGPPGKVVSRQHIEDLDVHIIRFANGATLTFKQTDFEKGSVSVRARFGTGIAGLPPHRESLAWMSGVVAPSGIADFDLDAIERLLTGRRINLDFGVDEGGFILAGSTNAEDLSDQLRLLASKLAFPRWDEPLFNRFRAGWLENYEMSFTSASARAARELAAITHPGDARWRPVEKDVIAKARAADLKRFFAPVLASGPVEAIIVGDVDLEKAIAAAAKTIGALPGRPQASTANIAVRPPQPDPKPKLFTHQGDSNQAFVLIGWSTFGGTDRIKERRALSLAANLLQVRLFDRLREEEGATYAPGVNANSSESFPAWGIFAASAEVKPESVDTFYRIAREEVAKLAKVPVPADEFARAQNPAISGITRRIKTNGYWLSAMEEWTSQPELIEQTRTHLSDYKNLTAEDVRAAIARHVADEGDWSMIVLPDKGKAGGN